MATLDMKRMKKELEDGTIVVTTTAIEEMTKEEYINIFNEREKQKVQLEANLKQIQEQKDKIEIAEDAKAIADSKEFQEQLKKYGKYVQLKQLHTQQVQIEEQLTKLEKEIGELQPIESEQATETKK